MTDGPAPGPVTVLGLGRMGHAVASRLLDAGAAVTVWNRSPGKAEGLRERGAREASSVAEAVRDAAVVITSLTGDAAVETVLLPDGAPVPELGGDVIDCSTVSAQTSRALGHAYHERFVAAPIAGAPQAVLDGKALLLVAGSPQAVTRAQPVLAAITARSQIVGSDPGLAAVAKLLNNFLLMTGIAALADVVDTGRAAGLGNAELRSLLAVLPVVAPGLANRVDHLIDGDHEAWFTVDLAVKDLGLADELAGAVGAATSLVAPVLAAYRRSAEDGHGDEDITAVVERS